MAIGIGANAAMFSLVDAVLLKPLPYPDPDRIVRVLEEPTPTTRNGIRRSTCSTGSGSSTSFEALSATRGLSVALTGEGEPSRLNGHAGLGRLFQGVRRRGGGGPHVSSRKTRNRAQRPVVVLSHAVWQDRFGGDPNILSRPIMLDGESHQVIGVLPPGSFDREVAGFWKPLLFAPEQRTRGYHWLGAVGRLKAGVTLDQARAEMRARRRQPVPTCSRP